MHLVWRRGRPGLVHLGSSCQGGWAAEPKTWTVLRSRLADRKLYACRRQQRRLVDGRAYVAV